MTTVYQAEAHTITPQPDFHIAHPVSTLDSLPARDNQTTEQARPQADDVLTSIPSEPEEPPASVSAATANPLESKLGQLLDVMTMFVQGQMNQQVGEKKRAIAQNLSTSTPQPQTQSQSETSPSDQPRKHKTG